MIRRSPGSVERPAVLRSGWPFLWFFVTVPGGSAVSRQGIPRLRTRPEAFRSPLDSSAPVPFLVLFSEGRKRRIPSASRALHPPPATPVAPARLERCRRSDRGAPRAAPAPMLQSPYPPPCATISVCSPSPERGGGRGGEVGLPRRRSALSCLLCFPCNFLAQFCPRPHGAGFYDIMKGNARVRGGFCASPAAGSPERNCQPHGQAER